LNARRMTARLAVAELSGGWGRRNYVRVDVTRP
jgi:hypothetical protein